MGKRIKVVRQAETAECGLACLVMIARAHGGDVDLNGVRQYFTLSMTGVTLRDIITMASQMGFSSRGLRLSMSSLEDLKTPCILHWNINHFVVLESVKSDRLLVHDPALGTRHYTLEEASKHFTGIALELQPVADFTPLISRTKITLSDLWDKITGWKWPAIYILLMSIVVQFTALVLPLFLQLAVDTAIPSGNKGLILQLSLAFGFLYFINVMSQAVRDWTILNIGQSVTFQIVGNVVHHLLHLFPDYFQKRNVGDIINRIESTQPIQHAFTQSVVAALLDAVMFLATIAFMLMFSWKLTLGVLLSFAFYFALVALTFSRKKVLEEEEMVSRSKEQSYVIETIRSSSVIKLFGREAEREASWRNLFAEVVNAGVKLGRLRIFLDTARRLIFSAQVIFVVYLGTVFIITDSSGFTIGMLFAFLSYRQQFEERAKALVERGVEFGLLRLHLERLSDIVQAPKESSDAQPHITGPIEDVAGSIELANINYAYSDNAPYVLNGVSLSVKAGEFLAICGTSGGGKSTLLKVMQALIVPNSGSIKIDGLPLETFGAMNWRRQIGVVQQEDSLLTGTLADNISFFDPEVNMEKVIQSAKEASIHNYISTLPMGYENMVGEMGAALSGGQKQRVMLARALYRDPKVLFLDEGTANLDQITEKAIGETISKMQMTRIVVAHRPELVNRADRVLEIRNGTVTCLREQPLAPKI